jgi:hypothetical protein
VFAADRMVGAMHRVLHVADHRIDPSAYSGEGEQRFRPNVNS